MRVCHSPELIAAYHGLHRLCVPRHPPHTLVRLTLSQSSSKARATLRTSDASSQITEPKLGESVLLRLTEVRRTIVSPPAEADSDHRLHDHFHQLLSNSRQIKIEIGCTGRATNPGLSVRTPRGRPTRRSGKEVIQPQVPLRLPCYDFAPVTALAFGGLVPCGFRHRLRALTASMA